MKEAYLSCSVCGRHIMKAFVGSHTEITCPKCRAVLEFKNIDENTIVTHVKEQSYKDKTNAAYKI